MPTEKYPDFKAGIYRHYKGPLYLVLGLGHDANYEERVVVIYIGLELDESKTGPRLSARTYEDFYSFTNSQGEAVGKDTPGAKQRFVYIGDSWEGKR